MIALPNFLVPITFKLSRDKGRFLGDQACVTEARYFCSPMNAFWGFAKPVTLKYTVDNEISWFLLDKTLQARSSGGCDQF